MHSFKTSRTCLVLGACLGLIALSGLLFQFQRGSGYSAGQPGAGSTASRPTPHAQPSTSLFLFSKRSRHRTRSCFWNASDRDIMVRVADSDFFSVQAREAVSLVLPPGAVNVTVAQPVDDHNIEISALSFNVHTSAQVVWGIAPSPESVEDLDLVAARPVASDARSLFEEFDRQSVRASPGVPRPWATSRITTTLSDRRVVDSGVLACYTGREAFLVSHGGMLFRWVAPGIFVRASGSGTNASQNIRITNGFWFAVTELTHCQYQFGIDPTKQIGGSDLPQGGLSWNLAAEWLRGVTNRGWGTYRLPTEAEWEYVCQAGALRHFGSSAPPEDIGNFARVGASPLPVASLSPNEWGFYDMNGNLRELCSDWFSFTPPSGIDPSGPSSGTERVRRGGGYDTAPEDGTCGCRDSDEPGQRRGSHGVRLVREPDSITRAIKRPTGKPKPPEPMTR